MRHLRTIYKVNRKGNLILMRFKIPFLFSLRSKNGNDENNALIFYCTIERLFWDISIFLNFEIKLIPSNGGMDC